MTIRLAVPSDYPTVSDLTLEAYLPALKHGEDDPYRATLADAAGRAEAAELLVATRDGRTVGTIALCRPGSEYAEIAHADELEVRMLAIDPSVQRAGIGSALMQHVHDTAAAEGYAGVVLSVIDTNERAAAFYHSLGYARVPERDWEPVPDVFLQVWTRPVGPVSAPSD